LPVVLVVLAMLCQLESSIRPSFAITTAVDRGTTSYWSEAHTSSPPSRAIIIDLGTLGGTHSQAAAINSVGEVVGSATTASGIGSHAVLWNKDGIVDLGAPAGYTYSGAMAVNASGHIAGYGFNPRRDYRGALWDSRSVSTLTPSDAISIAYGINNRAQVVGYINLEAARWEKGVPTMLGMLFGDNESIAYGVNDAGQVVGNSYNRFGDRASHAFIWENGIMNDLGTVPGGSGASAAAVNDRGHVVGDARLVENSAFITHAFLWQKGTMTDLGTLAGGGASAALALNSRDQVVGWSGSALGSRRAVLWQGNALIDLNDLLPANSGWVLREAVGINDQGVIAGNGEIDGKSHAFLLRLAGV